MRSVSVVSRKAQSRSRAPPLATVSVWVSRLPTERVRPIVVGSMARQGSKRRRLASWTTVCMANTCTVSVAVRCCGALNVAV